MNKQKIKYKLIIIFLVPFFGIIGYLALMRDLMYVINDFWHYRCYECKAVVDDPKKLISHIKLGCFDVKSYD